ncbi:MAG: hypothetical protein J1F64_09175, partial [Oscillospiraceae bacterium]|nr:hypothetical protein [Oscillospiraceae bacterium]
PVKDFCVKKDANGIMHILCINKQGDIVYIKNGGVGHTIIKSNGKIFARRLMMYECDHRISLVYTADYGDEILLIYCILGMNAMPVTVDTVKDDSFMLCDNKVYYQNSDGFLGYKDFSDGMPDGFIPVAENAGSAHIINFHGEDIMIYKTENGIVCGKNEVIEDKYAERPIISERGTKLLIVWQSGGFIRYAESDDGGNTFNTPMRFLNNNSSVQMYMIQKGDNFVYEYASEREYGIKLFGEKPDIRHTAGAGDFHINKEKEKIIIMLQMMKSDMAELKERVERLEHMRFGIESRGTERMSDMLSKKIMNTLGNISEKSTEENEI